MMTQLLSLLTCMQSHVVGCTHLLQDMSTKITDVHEDNHRDKETEPTVHSNGPEIVQHKGCAYCHIRHATHMEPLYVL